MITLYGIANCDTIRKTRKWLEQESLDYQFHDYKKLGCPAELCDTLLDQFPVGDIINTRGTTWRKLPEQTRAALNPQLARKLMQEQPSIIKRPILNIDDQWLLGYDTARIKALISK